jgi:membrane protein implicated in regulation of membrane protease activity
MASLHLPHSSPRPPDRGDAGRAAPKSGDPVGLSAVAETVREVFWVIALGAIACYAFFVALGAFAPGDVLGLSIAVGALLVLWLVHAWARSHRHADERDPRLSAARERRGF